MNNLAHRMTNQLELDVRAYSRDLYNARQAFIFKVPEEMTQTPFDFFGFTPSGRAIAIECKQVKRSALPIGTSNGLQGHQWSALELAYQCGAISMLIWRNGGETRVLPFPLLVELSAGRKSVSWPTQLQLDWQSEVRRVLSS